MLSQLYQQDDSAFQAIVTGELPLHILIMMSLSGHSRQFHWGTVLKYFSKFQHLFVSMWKSKSWKLPSNSIRINILFKKTVSPAEVLKKSIGFFYTFGVSVMHYWDPNIKKYSIFSGLLISLHFSKSSRLKQLVVTDFKTFLDKDKKKKNFKI